MPRYVILRHEFPAGHQRPLHWDLMLEAQGVLRTWALAAEPLVQGVVDAEQLPDHRLAYLDYEGPVSGDRGLVTRWDAGVFRLEAESAGQLTVAVNGRRLSGTLTLEQTETAGHFWRVSFSAEPTTG
jgi:hypothetical protein